mgnify:FL=1
MNTLCDRERVYLDYRDKVRRYISGKVRNIHDIEDLTSDVFVKVYEKLEKFDGEKASVSTWVYTITRNTVIDFYRTNKTCEELPETLVSDDGVDENVIKEESLSELCDALESLDERSRDLIIFHYYKGLTLKEIAEKMSISYSYANLLHNNALAKLKDFLS